MSFGLFEAYIARLLPDLSVSKSVKLDKLHLIDEGVEEHLAVVCNGSDYLLVLKQTTKNNL